MKGKKFISVLTMLAISATAVGTVVLSACKPKPVVEDEDIKKVEGKTYYVSTTGSASGDGSKENPYDPYSLLDFPNADDAVLKPGDTVLFEPGTYELENRIIMAFSGNYKNPITIKNADPTKKAVLSFYAMDFSSLNRGVSVDGSYFIWDSIDICGAGDNGMYIGGSYNTVLNSEFYDNRDTGLQLGRSSADQSNINKWPSYNLIKNCTAYNNYDNETYGENADGFAAKLTVGYHNVFDGCIAYRNSDDGWDLFAKAENGNIGAVIIKNCVAFDNGYLMETQASFNKKFPTYNKEFDEPNTHAFVTRDGDGNGFKLGGGVMEGDVIIENCMTFNNRMHGLTDNSNPGVLSIKNITSANNSSIVDTRSHLNIKDINNATSEFYHAIDSEGDIRYSNGAKVVVDEENKTLGSGKYARLKDGYILDSNNKYTTTDGKEFNEDDAGTPNDKRIKGSYIKAAATGQTVNPEFGYILMTGDDNLDHGNIDVARSRLCYNNISEVLSINTTGGLSSDAFRGATEYSVFQAGRVTTSYKISENVDTDLHADEQDAVYEEDMHERVNAFKVEAPVATDVIAELPSVSLGFRTDLHTALRNDDGSINMGDILKVKDYSKLFGIDHKTGADLAQANWDSYGHYSQTDMTALKTYEQSVMEAIKDIIFVPANNQNVYQNFKVLLNVFNSQIKWTSSDESVLRVTDVVVPELSLSSVKYVQVEVIRPEDADKQVTLTAEITYKNSENEKEITDKKEFVLNIKKAAYRIGDLEVENVVDGTIILEKFVDEEPGVTVYDGSDYSGKKLDPKNYDISTKYEIDEENDGNFITRPDFSNLKSGVYRITKTVTLKNSTEKSKSFTYSLYVVDPDGTVDFKPDASSLSVNKEGFVIKGALTNVVGTLYAAVDDGSVTLNNIKEKGAAYSFRSDEIVAQFKADNSKGGYNVKYAIANQNGKITTKLYSVAIEQEAITTCDEFASLAQTGGVSSKIYSLQNDLDFTGRNYAPTKNSFVGLLNGNGHVIKGISVSSDEDAMSGIFGGLKGGTIMNIGFEDISLASSKNKVGIICEAYSGFLYNISMRRVSASGAQRVGALIGQALEGDTPLVIDRISLDNSNSASTIFSESQRSGGIIGLIQPTSNPVNDIDVRVSNCYVNSSIGKEKADQTGGIIGTYDTQKTSISFSLVIEKCYFAGTAMAKNRCGGILGYQQGVGTLRFKDCVSFGDIYHAGSAEPIVVAEKNSSGIMGGYVAAADMKMENCYAKFVEHNTKVEVSLATLNLMTNETFWKMFVSFDVENVWQFAEKEGNALKAPYITLKSL